jgi:hypothetical protein
MLTNQPVGSHPLPRNALCAGDPVEWETEYQWLCGKLGLSPLLPSPPNPMAPTAPYYDEPSQGMAVWGQLGLRDGALWQNVRSWVGHLACSRGGGGREFAGVAGFFLGWSERERAGNELLWRTPMVGGRHAVEAPSLVRLPLVFQSLVNAFSSKFSETVASRQYTCVHICVYVISVYKCAHARTHKLTCVYMYMYIDIHTHAHPRCTSTCVDIYTYASCRPTHTHCACTYSCNMIQYRVSYNRSAEGRGDSAAVCLSCGQIVWYHPSQAHHGNRVGCQAKILTKKTLRSVSV